MNSHWQFVPPINTGIAKGYDFSLTNKPVRSNLNFTQKRNNNEDCVVRFKCCNNFTIVFVGTGLYWEKAEITWAITDSPNPSRMDKTRIENVIEECFEMWAVVTPFTFDKVVPEEEVCARIEPIDLRIPY